MKSNFEERKANRLEAYKNLAAKNEKISEQTFKSAQDIASCIPMGQPIMVGHHSEKRHRRDIQRIDNSMRKSVEASDKAKYYEARAETLLNGTAISSDDPNAIDKLQEKLEKLEAGQELMKQVNKVIKLKISDLDKVQRLVEMGLKETTAIKLLEPEYGRIGIPPYRLSNNNAVIRNTRQRIEQLQKIAALVTSEEVINGVTLKISAEDNRVQLFFPGKPSDEIRTELKRNGFRWSPSIGAWMRQISNGAIWAAKSILNK